MTSPRHRSAAGLALAATTVLSALSVHVLAAPTAAAAPSTDALIAEVYGGGGNSGSPIAADFVELATRGAAVRLSGWSVQYLPAAPKPTSRWQVTPLTGDLQPGRRYLVAQARGGSGGAELPTPDATGSVNLSASAGTVALVAGTEPLSCLTTADCAADRRVRDLVGYGDAVVREGRPAPAASNGTSVARADRLPDTDDNAADLVSGPPTPTNSRGEGPGGGGDPGQGGRRIHDIQGVSRISPLVGRKVSDVPGVVTAVRAFGASRGFWFQDPQPDDDPRTSEGLFVFTGNQAPQVKPGDAVLVSGTVAEFRPVGNGETPDSSPNQTVTQITDARWTVTSAGNPLPAAERLRPDSVPTAMAPDARGGSIEGLPLEPRRFALDFLESREGMRVRVDDARVIGPTDGHNGLWITTKPEQNRTPRGGTVYLSYEDANSGRLKVESLIPFAQRPFPRADVGDLLRGVTEGPLDYTRFGGYVLQASALGEHVSKGLTRETTRPQHPSELAVATYNVENLSARDDQTKVDRLAVGVVRHLASPDVVALEEIQDNSGPADDGVVAADATLRRFVDAVAAAGGPRYEWRQIDPANRQDGGQPGGNIRQVFLFNPKRVSFVDRAGGDATTPVRVRSDHGRAALSVSPGRIDPANPAWQDSRKPLAGEFVFHGRTVFVIANHFNSKGGDQPIHGRYQPPNRVSEVQRQQQAAVVRGFVDQIQRVDQRSAVLVVGDLNDYVFSPAVRTLVRGGALRSPLERLPEGERYSYVFEGNSQVLDHILVSGNVRQYELDVVHLNAEFHDQASDHDPQVLRFRPPTGPWRAFGEPAGTTG
ncbi:hypothetical protein LX15_001744 [Streptoalloteichus tenebrarius]|uniref:LTD domain-containing protein n=1 Tax=Streptoalloteichus tenebrarius (strain ATCC 17920 / DSM 40477 / JCM 4838 / CBS 697.72 / NBRC 16177 / NCIMB 11028 / NRRL B-12390 / A12253. 1 / ISP 5477) TaxID=1933 RepID=A0ABT1HRA8_STRSD|nr:endonuclease/exonuclease/phosphatase family protein [Streptoalloteichus tenebrarius]MCP2258057.1 hypothetical protein [Streptoalloteichus tenebrarius]